MDEQRLVHPDIVPDAGFTSAWKTQRFDPGRADVPEFEVAIVRSKRHRKPAVARGSTTHGDYSVAKSDGHIDLAQDRLLKTGYRGAFSSAEQQEQQPALLSVKTGIEVSSPSFRKRSSVMASKSLRSIALSLRLRPRNLLKIRIAPSVDGWPDNADRRQHDLCSRSNTWANDAAICAPTKSLGRNGL